MKIIKQKFKIDGMHCTSCALNIDMDLEDLAGIKTANTSYAKQETVIEFDQDIIQLEKILLTIRNTGYEAHPQDT